MQVLVVFILAPSSANHPTHCLYQGSSLYLSAQQPPWQNIIVSSAVAMATSL
jgi:hypothetical protein